MAKKEYKEIVFDNENIILSGNYVKGAILPKRVDELGRDITVKSDSVIEGAVFGNRIEILGGDLEVRGSLFANTELHVGSDTKGEVTFCKSVASSGSVVSYARGCTLSFLSDINAKSVKMSNAYVAGSVFGDEVVLENCVVIGGVFATATLDLNNCVVGTFNAPTVRAAGINHLLLPSAFSVEKISVIPGTEFYNLSLADLGGLYRGDTPIANTGKIRIDIDSDELRTVLTSEDNSVSLRSYTVVGKVLAADLLDFEKMQNHFLLTAASLGNQLLRVYDLGKNAKGEVAGLDMPAIRTFFFNIMSGKLDLSLIDGDFSISDIKDRFNPVRPDYAADKRPRRTVVTNTAAVNDNAAEEPAAEPEPAALAETDDSPETTVQQENEMPKENEPQEQAEFDSEEEPESGYDDQPEDMPQTDEVPGFETEGPLYHILIGEQQVAGQTIADIAFYLSEGKASPDTLVWRSGLEQWTSIASLPELAPLLE